MVKAVTPLIEVGILAAERIRFSLQGNFRIRGSGEIWRGEAEAVVKVGHIRLLRESAAEEVAEGAGLDSGDPVILEPESADSGQFMIRDVVIGIGFHWEQKEDQRFRGTLKLMVVAGKIQVVNIIPVEDYLVSVISSEMSGESAPALLKAHTIISRSWLLAQIDKQERLVKEDSNYEMVRESEEEYIRWYDREDHDLFHVCADDHCQRYQGITRALNPEVERAVKETAGEVLTYGGRICDARFSKCCGGVVEQFEYCWEPVHHPYLERVDDNPDSAPVNKEDLKIEENAVHFIHAAPKAFCNTDDQALLVQVLNDYDQASKNFYRWTVVYDQQELSSLIRKRSGIDFGKIIDLVPVQRGESGRLVKLKIVGTKRIMTIGKELEIRRWLSESHLYSAAFTVEKRDVEERIPGRFILRGAGWGHGVGLCQIGAAVMASKGYSHREILSHYFINANIEKRYE